LATSGIQTAEPDIKKVFIKAVTKGGGKESKVFALRNIKPNEITSCDSLKSVIRCQLSDDIVKGSFDVGVVQNSSSAVSFRSAEDVAETWEHLRTGKKVTLWCDGMLSSKKRKRKCPDEESENEEEYEIEAKSKKKKESMRADKVDDVVKALKAQHGSLYTPMQFRIWADMIVGDMHTSSEEPPSSTMFLRSGSQTVKRKPSTSDVVIQVADKLATALSPKAASPRNSPAKVIENRSRCYKQLSELTNFVNRVYCQMKSIL
jgi:hypothetical protein